MNSIVDKSIVLRRVDFGEADRIVTMLTSKNGKVSVISKGSRRPKSKMAGGIELFTVNNITYLNGKNELKTLVSAHAIEHYSQITSNLTTANAAYEILKYVHIYTEVVFEDEYFDICVQSLRALDAGQPVSVVLVWFGIQLMQISGHGINLRTDDDGMPLDVDDTFSFDFSKMAFSKDSNGVFTSKHIKLLRLCSVTTVDKLTQVQNIQQLSSQIQATILECVKYNSQSVLQ
ncbi:MAG: DNA repair protein RecO [bacterium]